MGRVPEQRSYSLNCLVECPEYTVHIGGCWTADAGILIYDASNLVLKCFCIILESVDEKIIEILTKLTKCILRLNASLKYL